MAAQQQRLKKHYSSGSNATASLSLKLSSAHTGSILSCRHLTYSVPVKGGEDKVLVDDVSLDVKAGELLAIMVHFPFTFFLSGYALLLVY